MRARTLPATDNSDMPQLEIMAFLPLCHFTPGWLAPWLFHPLALLPPGWFATSAWLICLLPFSPPTCLPLG